MTSTIIYSAIIITTLVATPVVFAESTTVTNSIYSSATTGGNSANGGVVEEGTSKAKVFIKTTVNGKVVEYVNETAEASGEGVKIEKETYYEANNAKLEADNSTDTLQENTQNTLTNTSTQSKEVEKNNQEITNEKSSFVATIFQKLINYVFSIFRK